jgi:DHA1 family multidrug resistance protein-like MFS transporter
MLCMFHWFKEKRNSHEPVNLTVTRKVYSSTVLVLGVVQFIEALAFFLPQAYFPMYITSLGASVASVGIFVSAFTLSSVVLSPVIGRLIDRFGGKKLILGGLAGDFIFGLLTGLAPTWHWLLVIRLLNGAVSAASTLSAEVLLISSVSASRRGEAVGFTAACAMAGRWMGPIFGGSIQSISKSFGLSILNSYRIPYFVDSVLAVFALALVAWKARDSRKIAVIHSMTSKAEKRKMKFTTSMVFMMFFSFTYGGALGLTMTLSALLYNDKFGVAPFTIGAILSATGLIGFGASWVAGRISDRLGRKPVLALGEGVGRIMGVLLPLMPSVGMTVLSHLFRKAGFSISRPAADALKADTAPSDNMGEYFGFCQTAYMLGDVAFPVIGTYLYSTYMAETFSFAGFSVPGYATPYFLSSLLGLIGLITVLIFVKPQIREDAAKRGKIKKTST